MMGTEDKEFASPACLLHEADPGYADPKFAVPQLIEALERLLAAERSLFRCAVDGIRRTDDPGQLTLNQRLARRALKHEGEAAAWLERLGGPVEPLPAVPVDLPPQDQEAIVLRLLAELLPRVADPALHQALLAMQALHLGLPPP